MNKLYDFSDILEKLDIPRAPARIVAALLSAESGSQSSTDLQQTTLLSKAAVSGALQYLDALGVISYSVEPNGRKRVAHLHPTKLANYLKRRMTTFHDMADHLDALAVRQTDVGYKNDILYLAVLCTQLDKTVNETIAKWEGKK